MPDSAAVRCWRWPGGREWLHVGPDPVPGHGPRVLLESITAVQCYEAEWTLPPEPRTRVVVRVLAGAAWVDLWSEWCMDYELAARMAACREITSVLEQFVANPRDAARG